jgi:hypothetical protein
MIRIALPFAALTLIGCIPAPQEPPSPPPVAATPCGSHRIGDLVGKQRSDAVAEDAKARSGAGRIRWIAPGQMVTMDYSEGRLNIYTDEAGKITELRCG